MQSGGMARIRSTRGEGTTVELWLPQATAPPSERLDRSGPKIDRGAARVLLCDDDDGVRDLLGEFLSSAGYTVHEASDGEEALRILDSGAVVDLLITDYAMPGLNGLETIREARLRRPALRSLVITGHAGSLAGDTAGVPILRKPFSPNDLARRMTALLATDADPP
jgi:CheY-like chemotaxis protein